MIIIYHACYKSKGLSGALQPSARGLVSLITVEVLEQVLYALTPVRNICAHHGRLWNRRFAMSLPKIKRIQDRLVPPEAPHGQSHYLFNFLVVLDTLMTATSPGSSWTRRAKALIETLDQGHAAMGFPADWRDREPWRSRQT